MGLVFHLICLFFTLFVLQSYISSGFHAREHRLLPLTLGLIALNNFYHITYYISGEEKTLRILTDLLVIHMLYLMIHYVGDFMKFQLKLKTEVVLFSSLILFNLIFIVRAAQGKTYQDAFRIALLCYAGILLVLATYVRVKSEVSAWEGHVNDMLYLGIALPGVALLFRVVTPKAEEFLVPGAFEVSCLIVFYLMMTGRLSNVTNIIRENFYNISDVPTFLFDHRMRYRDSNASAVLQFPEIVEELTDYPMEYSFYTKMMRWSKEPRQDYVVQWKKMYCKCQLHPVCSENVVRGYILTLLDITQQKQETVLMEQLKKKAEKQSVLKSRFLASVSHDLRSPLHAIIGGSDILKRQHLPQESQNILTYIYSAGNNLLEQVDTILAYSKLEAGVLTLKEKTYNFYEMIEEQARVCLLNVQKKEIVFTVDFLDQFPEMVIGDSIRVAQIFQNVLSNACKFTKQGTITLSIHCKMEDGQVCFDGCVEDTGVGMSKETCSQVFREYVSFSEEAGVEGTGLGLSIVRQLVEMMHGWVKAESEPGNGTRVSFRFYQRQTKSPLRKPVCIGQEILKEQSGSNEEEIRPNWVYPQARVLLVDDMEANRVIFQELAMPWKFMLDLAASGEEAVQLVKQRNYQMIILDQMMPEMSGFEAADQIQRYSNAPLVLMTADISDEVRNDSILHGFTDFMSKPIRLHRLRQVIETGISIKYREIPKSVDTESTVDVRILETYRKEVEELLTQLPEYVQRDLHMFQTKVHGIKGISRQIGREETARQAEIMEMAAKTQNRDFINRNLHLFLEQLKKTVEEVRQETKDRQNNGPVLPQETLPVIEENQRQLCWKELKHGFDTYDLAAIEENLKILSGHELPAEEKKRLPVVREAYENLDYETGSKACSF